MTIDHSPSELASIRGRTNALKSKQSHKTRESIRAATRQLAASSETINVTTVSEAAGISRGTFYTHYADIEQLGIEILRLDFTSQPFSIDDLVDHYVRNRHFYRHVLEETTSRAVLESVVAVVAEALLDARNIHLGDGHPLEKEAIFTAWGYIGTMDWWLRRELSHTPTELKEFLSSRTPASLIPPGGS